MKQSTHLVSVHEAVTQSVAKLKEKYTGIGQEEVIAEIREKLKTIKINQMPEEFYRQAAIDSFERILKNKDWVEHFSGLSLPELLTLVWTAAKDQEAFDVAAIKDGQGKSTTPEKDTEDRLTAVVEYLWRAQREYNLSAAGTDDISKLASPACLPGTFNKIVEAIEFHPIVTMGKNQKDVSDVVPAVALKCYGELKDDEKEKYRTALEAVADLGDKPATPEQQELANKFKEMVLEEAAKEMKIPKTETKLIDYVKGVIFLEYPVPSKLSEPQVVAEPPLPRRLV